MMQLNNRNVVMQLNNCVLISRSPHSILKHISSLLTCVVLYCANYCAKSHAVV